VGLTLAGRPLQFDDQVTTKRLTDSPTRQFIGS